MTFLVAFGLPTAFAAFAVWMRRLDVQPAISWASLAVVALIVVWRIWPSVTTWYANPLAAFGYQTWSFPVLGLVASAISMLGRWQQNRIPHWFVFLVTLIATFFILDRASWRA
jgi:hypothetical protein